MKYFLMLTNAIIVVSFGLLYRSLPPEIPIYYSLGWGERQLGGQWSLLLILLQINLFYFITRMVGNHYFRGDRYIGNIITYANITFISIALSMYIRTILLIS